MAQTKNLMVIDDDPKLRELLVRYLTEQGFHVDAFADGSQLARRLQHGRPDLLILDLMLPEEDGLSIVRRLRGQNDLLPIIMLTAKGDDIDRIIGLEMGADDYLPKPFNPRELVARIQSVLRRQAAQPAGIAPLNPQERFEFGNMILDVATRSLTRDGEPVSMTNAEFALLRVLAAHSRQPLSRERLLELARGREYDAFDRSIDVQISRLRKLVEADPAHPQIIQTVWGFGYVFVPDGLSR